MTGPAGRPPQAQPGEPAITERTFLYQFSGQAEASDAWTADAAHPADSPLPYTLTAKAETLLGEADAPTNPTTLLRKGPLLWYGNPTSASPTRSPRPAAHLYDRDLLPPTAEEISKLAGIYGGETALPVVPVAYLRQLSESRALLLAMNRSPIAVKVRPVWRRASFRLRANPPAYVPMPGPVAFPQIKPGAEGGAA